MMDNMFSNKWFVRFISLCIAIMLFMMINMNNNVSNQASVLPDQEDSTFELEDVELIVDYDEENYSATATTPDELVVQLSGSQTSLTLFQLSNTSYEVYVDVEGLGPGEHQVPIENRNFPADLEVAVSPEYATVVVEDLESVSYPVEIELTNEDEAEETYQADDFTVTPANVTVQAGSSVHESINEVSAFVDVSGAAGTIEGEKDVVAYDNQGNEMNVQIEPEAVNVSMGEEGTSAEVPITLTREGTPQDGVSVAALNPSQEEALVSAPQDVLDNLDTIEAPVDLSGIGEEGGTIEVTLPVPEGADAVQPETIEVEVEIGEGGATSFSNIPINIENVPEGQTVQWESPADGAMNVSVEGAADSLEGLDAGDISLSADWQEGGNTAPGTAKTLTLQASGPDNINVSPASSEVTVSTVENEAESGGAAEESEGPDEAPTAPETEEDGQGTPENPEEPSPEPSPEQPEEETPVEESPAEPDNTEEPDNDPNGVESSENEEDTTGSVQTNQTDNENEGEIDNG
ncbi:YbbR-like domain-containing protein [Sinobaca sp. H24]|uniref:CdaR family protein n=1 Tax=Sinobaca sp. H24 TaxID=2923376 RepID=UPI0020798B07|nr:CdaR family protein [Sinobaca sp. H24]